MKTWKGGFKKLYYIVVCLSSVLLLISLATSGRQIWAEQMGVIISAYHETGLRNQGGEGIRAAR